MALEMLNPAGQADPQGAPSVEAAAPVGQPPVDPIQVSMEEAKKNRQMLDASIERMRGALQQRTKLPFDPMLMRVAAEAGKPTKTGSFFESLGNIAGGTLEEGENERKRKLETEGKLYELELKRYEAQRKEIGRRALNSALGAEPGASGGAGGGAGPGQHISLQRIAQLNDIDPDLGKYLMNLGEYNLKFFKETKDGIYDIREPNKPVVKFEQPAVDTNLPFIGSVKVPPSVRDRVYAVRDEGKKQGWDIKRYKSELAKVYAEEGIGSEFIGDVGNITMGAPKPVGGEPAPTGAAVIGAAGAPSAGKPALLSGAEVKKSEAYTKGDTEEDIKNRAEVGSALFKTFESAPAMQRLAGQNIKMANSEAGKAVLGKISGSPKLADRFFDMLSTGVRTPAGTLEIPGINDFVTLLGATPEQINTYKQIVQNAAEASLLFRRMYLVGNGQGTVTEGEQAMASRLAPTERDTPTSFAFKSHVLQARATLDQKRYEAFDQWKKNPENAQKSGRDFMLSPANKRLESNYDKWLDHTFHNFFGEPLIPRGQAGKPGQRMGNLESQIR